MFKLRVTLFGTSRFDSEYYQMFLYRVPGISPFIKPRIVGVIPNTACSTEHGLSSNTRKQFALKVYQKYRLKSLKESLTYLLVCHFLINTVVRFNRKIWFWHMANTNLLFSVPLHSRYCHRSVPPLLDSRSCHIMILRPFAILLQIGT